MPVSLQSHGMTDLRIENMEEGRLRIAFDLRFNVIADLKAPPLESIRATLREDLAQLLSKCQSLGVEPFGFAAVSYTHLDVYKRQDDKRLGATGIPLLADFHRFGKAGRQSRVGAGLLERLGVKGGFPMLDVLRRIF